MPGLPDGASSRRLAFSISSPRAFTIGNRSSSVSTPASCSAEYSPYNAVARLIVRETTDPHRYGNLIISLSSPAVDVCPLVDDIFAQECYLD